MEPWFWNQNWTWFGFLLPLTNKNVEVICILQIWSLQVQMNREIQRGGAGDLNTGVGERGGRYDVPGENYSRVNSSGPWVERERVIGNSLFKKGDDHNYTCEKMDYSMVVEQDSGRTNGSSEGEQIQCNKPSKGIPTGFKRAINM